MIKILILLFCISSHVIAWTPPEAFNSAYIELEDSIFSSTMKGRYRDAKSALSSKVVKSIFNDDKKLIKKIFTVPKYFEPSVQFWFSIYTQYSSKQVVIHDMNNLKLVYNVLDFSELHSNQGIHRFSKSKLQAHLALEYTRGIKKILNTLSRGKFKKNTVEADDILRIIKDSGLKIPKRKKNIKKFFLKLANSIRTQTGQRNKIYKGVIRSIPYLPYLVAQTKNFKLPQEVLAIPFLESSFNPIAKSKVAATGMWQFIPYIGNLFMPKISKYIDYRNNPIISSISALHLLKENRLIMRRWDLAIPAYNSGPKHLKKAIKKFSKYKKKKDISLEYILKNYKHAHIGFASKNFYSEFLALVHVLAYKDMIYPIKGIQIKDKFENPTDIGIYISKCSLKPNKFFRLLEKNSPKIREINSHFLVPSHIYPRGTLVVSDRKLTNKKYYRLTNKQLRSRFPKKYVNFIKGKPCR